MRGISAINRKLFRDMLHMRGQGFAVAIIVACGVAIMVMALGALSSLQASQDAYYDRFRFAEVFAQVKRAPERLNKQVTDVPGVRRSETRITVFVTLQIDGFLEPANAKIISLPETGQPVLNHVLLHKGRFPFADRLNEAVISKAFADGHGFVPGDRISVVMNGKIRELNIVGIGDSPEYVYTLGPGALLPDDKRFGVFWMSRKTLEAAFDLEGAFNDLSIMLDPGVNPNLVISRVDAVLNRYGGIGAYAREDQLSHAFLDSQMQELKSMAVIIPPIFLTVSALLLNAILGRLIATERQQIGVLKAFGYTNIEVGWHYLKVALIITALGIILGSALGAVLARLMTHLYSDSFRFPVLLYQPHFASFVIGGGAALMAAVLGALAAANQAATLVPAEAMNPAPPASYKRGALQKMLAKLSLDEPTRMILRHITRWPFRSMTTTFGIAASMGLLIGTLFSFDSIDYLTDTFFYRTDPYEVAFNFVEPTGNEAILEFQRLPGITSVEANRQAAVHLRHGQFNERTAIIGLEVGSQNKRVLDKNDEIFSLPHKGITLSRQLAKLLRVSIGDEIDAEFLVGRRTNVDLAVTAIAHDYIGKFAYIERAQLNELLMEGNAVTGGYAKLDPALMEAFQSAVLARPAIASVALQSASINSFEETLDETISIMMTIYALIGGAIAAGVIYNSARIALTERGRELASMRVLGFTQNEVAYILLGELFLLCLLALPLGALLGTLMAYAIASSMSSDLYRVPFLIEAKTFGMAALIVVTSALLSSAFVIKRVRNLDMIAVLKTKE